MADGSTQDFGLTKPEPPVDLDDYHGALDRLDARLVGRGPLADRPSSMSTDALWVVTDSGTSDISDNTLTRWTGTEWVVVGKDTEGVFDDVSEIGGDIVNRAESITELSGNILIRDQMPSMSNVNDGDIVVIR